MHYSWDGARGCLCAKKYTRQSSGPLFCDTTACSISNDPVLFPDIWNVDSLQLLKKKKKKNMMFSRIRQNYRLVFPHVCHFSSWSRQILDVSEFWVEFSNRFLILWSCIYTFFILLIIKHREWTIQAKINIPFKTFAHIDLMKSWLLEVAWALPQGQLQSFTEATKKNKWW